LPEPGRRYPRGHGNARGRYDGRFERFRIGTQGATTVIGCTISGNHAGDGGAGSVDGGSGGNGGGLYVAGGQATITGSTFSGNAGGTGGDGGSGTAGYGGYGGGIESNKGTTVIMNSTVTGNHGGEGGAGTPAGNNGNGGGVDNSNDGTLTLINCTISGNHTGSSRGYGGGANNFGALTFRHTIIANNTASSLGPDCIGTTSLHSDGYNLVENTDKCPIDSNANNVYGQDPLLGTLGDYGGPTLTFEPQPGSPVVDAGNPAGCTHHEGGPLTVDQRGFPRHVDGGSGSATCDIGAVELQPRYLLTVNVGGAGTVTSDWDDVDCGNDCTGWYGDGASATLTATPSGDWSTFIGWGGACSGTGSCVVVMDQARTVTAAFVADNQVYVPVIRRE